MLAFVLKLVNVAFPTWVVRTTTKLVLEFVQLGIAQGLPVARQQGHVQLAVFAEGSKSEPGTVAQYLCAARNDSGPRDQRLVIGARLCHDSPLSTT